MKNNKIFKIAIAFFVLLQVMTQFSYNSVKANSTQIVQDLHIVNPKEQYYPGDSVIMSGRWVLEDDSENHEYKAGDQFSITIPEGMTPNFSSINLSGYGVGKVVGNKVVFTLSDHVEQEVDRNGGFNLMFTVDTPDLKEKVDVPFEVKDDYNNSLLKGEIVIDNAPYDGIIPDGDKSNFYKASAGQNSGEGLSWFVHVNQARKFEPGIYTFTDRTDENHIIDFDSLRIRAQNENSGNVGEHLTDINIIKHEDQHGFTVDLEITASKFGEKELTTYYDIIYNTIYVGDQTDGEIILKNKATLTKADGEQIPQDNEKINHETEGMFNLGGWGVGTRIKGDFALTKVDEITGKSLANAKFKLTGKYDQSVYEFTTNEEGIGTLKDLPNGIYLLEEVEAPEGYQLGEPVEINIKHKNNEVFEYTYTNRPHYKEISVQKIWQDHTGAKIDPAANIVIQLLANGNVIKQARLQTDNDTIVFKRLVPYDENGIEINYEINEILLDGFTNKIEAGESTNYIITNIQDEPVKPEEPEEPKPEEPKPEEPEEPKPEEPKPEEPKPEEPKPEEPKPEEPKPEEPKPEEPKPEEPVEVEEVLGESENLNKKPTTLPQTGKGNYNFMYGLVIALGILMKRKK